MFSFAKVFFPTIILLLATAMKNSDQSDYRHLVTTIVIDAPAEKVWKVLMDFEAYPDWNPFVKKIVGQPMVGNTLEVTLQPHGNKESTFNTKVITVTLNKHFAWKGKLLFGGLFDGTHHFELEQISPIQTRLIQHEYFNGLLVPMLKKMLTEDTKISFDALNAALKRKSELVNSSEQAVKLN